MNLFRYIFKRKVLIVVTILLLLAESLCLLFVPFLGSVVIDYGIQQHGIVYSSPTLLCQQTYDLIAEMLPDESVEIFKKSYTQEDKTFENNQKSYLLNDYGYYYIDDLDEALGPVMAYIYNNKVDKQDIKDFISGKEKLSENDIAIIKSDFLSYLNSKDSKNFYIDAIRMKINNSDLFDIDISATQVEFTKNMILIFICVLIIYILVSTLSNYAASWISYANSKELRRKLFDKIMDFHGQEFDKFSKGSLITRSTNDIQNIQNACLFLVKNVLISPIFVLIAVLVSFSIAPDLAWSLLVVFGLIIVFSIIIMVIVSGQFVFVQKIIDKINTVAKEYLNGIFVVRAFNYDQFQIDKFNKLSKELYKKMVRANSFLVIAIPLLIMLINLLCVFAIWIGKDMIADNNLSVGSLTAFMFFSVEAIMSFLSIAIALILFPRAEISAKRIEEVLNTENSIVYKNDHGVKDSLKDICIEFKNVSFRFNDEDDYVIKNASFKLLPNSNNVIVGKIGAGKSTIFNLILRYYDVIEGEILINNINIKDLGKNDLNSLISYVPQKPVVYSDSIKNNININKDSTDMTRINSVIENVQLSGLVQNFEDGVDHIVAQDGLNLSGGQIQRINIARALYKDSPIFIFDDIFASVDQHTEQKILNSISQNYKDRIFIYSTQRLDSIKESDNIIFISESGDVDFDKHSNLINNNMEYKKFFTRAS